MKTATVVSRFKRRIRRIQVSRDGHPNATQGTSITSHDIKSADAHQRISPHGGERDWVIQPFNFSTGRYRSECRKKLNLKSIYLS